MNERLWGFVRRSWKLAQRRRHSPWSGMSAQDASESATIAPQPTRSNERAANARSFGSLSKASSFFVPDRTATYSSHCEGVGFDSAAGLGAAVSGARESVFG